MLAQFLPFALLIAYASAQCRSMSGSYSTLPPTPLEVCYPESYDGTDYVYAIYKCIANEGNAIIPYSVMKYTYSDAACTADESFSISSLATCAPFDDCFCDSTLDTCEYATYVTWDTCTDQQTYSNGAAVVVSECLPTFDSSLYDSLKHSCYPSSSLLAYPGSYETQYFTDDSCAVPVTPSPTEPTTPYPTLPPNTPYPTYPPVTPAPTPVSCTRFTGGCSNYSGASSLFAAAAFVVAGFAYFMQ